MYDSYHTVQISLNSIRFVKFHEWKSLIFASHEKLDIVAEQKVCSHKILKYGVNLIIHNEWENFWKLDTR